MVGDTNDMLARLKSVLPVRWFADTTPILDAVLNGFAWAWCELYALLGFVKLQTRLASASGIFLDIAAIDYFGLTLSRHTGESDAAFSLRLRANLIAPRATRAGLVLALENETGRTPFVFEPLNATDTGGYNSYTLGYGMVGGYGCQNLPFQFFVQAFRPNASPISNAGGYNDGPGGYGVAPMFYSNVSDIPGIVTDADIYAAAAGVLPVATTAWIYISN
ncbi:MAG: hypothetical protein POG74_05595 [Acidocella sp.]|nr:hypothetical protein [Acidocella sp.]